MKNLLRISLIIIAALMSASFCFADQTHNFHLPGDADWVSFDALCPGTYYIETRNLGSACDTIIELYEAPNLTTPLAMDDDSGGGGASRIVRTITDGGSYYVKVYHKNPSVFGINTRYDLSVSYDYNASPVSDVSPVFRFWSGHLAAHFWTANAGEKDFLIATYPDIWSYEGIGFYAYASAQAGALPVYRFWSNVYESHYFTINQSERDFIIANWSGFWTYEGIAYYAYDYQHPGTLPVYRFWSSALNSHHFTIDQAERDYIISAYSSTWTYEGIAFYAYQRSIPAYRFWSGLYNSHHYTIDEAEKSYLVTNWPQVWSYEGVAFNAYANCVCPSSPVYRFLSTNSGSHFFTVDDGEKDILRASYSLSWAYEGIAFYAFPSRQSGTLPVYRFWSSQMGSHHYTIDEWEKNYIISNWPGIWTYEGIAWYAFPGQ